MLDPKETFIIIHEELIMEYLEANPNAGEDEAYEATAQEASYKLNEGP